MITVRREKNGKTHHAEQVAPGGCVVRWGTDPAKAVALTAEQAAAVRAFYAPKKNAGTLVFSDGSCVETPTDAPPGPDNWTRLRTALDLPAAATMQSCVAAAVEELEAYRGTKEGLSSHVVEVADPEKAALVEQNEELTARVATLTREIDQFPKTLTIPVGDAELETLMAGQSVEFAGECPPVVTLTRPTVAAE